MIYRTRGEHSNHYATDAVFLSGLTRPGLKPKIYPTRGEHANHYITDVVYINIC